MMVLKGNGYIKIMLGVDDQALEWLPSLMLTQYPCGPRGCVQVSCTLC